MKLYVVRLPVHSDQLPVYLLILIVDNEGSRGTVCANETTYNSVTHRGHDSVSSLVESTLDHPFLSGRDTNDRADSGRRNGIDEL